MKTPLSSSEDPSLEFSNEKKQLLKELNRLEKRTRLYLAAKQSELENSRRWEEVQHEGHLLQTNLHKIKRGMSSVEVEDWLTNVSKILSLDSTKSPHENAEKRFQKSKKLRKAEPYLLKTIEQLEQRLRSIDDEKKVLEGCQTMEEIVEKFPPKVTLQAGFSKKTQPAPTKPYKVFYSNDGTEIWVGKSAKDNDQLSFSHANGLDWWMHVSEFPGSHIVIRTKKGSEPEKDTLEDAMQLALEYSKAKNQGSAEVVLTQCKYLSRYGKGVHGKVTLSKHKKLVVKHNLQRLEAIRERKGTINPRP